VTDKVSIRNVNYLTVKINTINSLINYELYPLDTCIVVSGIERTYAIYRIIKLYNTFLKNYHRLMNSHFVMG
jgi:hypothetical protein